MRYNNLPGTSLYLSLLSLGTMMFGGQTGEAESLAIMDFAFEHGINSWDTADVYNQGECERIVGKGLRGRREEVFLATKVFFQMGENAFSKGLSRKNIISAFEASRKRLNTDYIDLYYLHAPDYETDIEETMETVTNLVRQGKLRYVGVSNFAAWQIADIFALCDRRGYIAPVMTQNVYNLITRGIEAELVPFLTKHNTGLSVYNPIAGGMLAGKHQSGTPHENTRFSLNKSYYDRYWSEENFSAIKKLTAAAGEYDLSILKLAIQWVASRRCVTTIISGVSKLSQLEQNIAAVEGCTLPNELLAACDDVWKSLAGTRFAYNR